MNNYLMEDTIAIVSVSCRFPGGADNPELYWQLLENNIDAITNPSADRWNIGKWLTEKGYLREGGFLKNVDLFDPGFFHITPLEAESLDPQLRLLLELSYEAFERGNIKINNLQGSDTGVFMGLIAVNYEELLVGSENIYSVIGSMRSSASGRLSFMYDLQGPSVSLDTACSSSLTAVHLACKSLLQGDCNMALAGGVNLNLSTKGYIDYHQLGALSTDCRCKAFDAAGNGFVRSEGAGIVILKRYQDAVSNGDNILAIIAGTAITNDGSGKGYTVPNTKAQEKLIIKAIKNAGASPDDIDYIEAHGTGTAVGDPLEMEGIANAFRNRIRKEKIWVGSSKTNIGHTESAAGIAGLIKVILSLQHNCIPASLHFNTPNPNIPWDSIPAAVANRNIEWARGEKPRFAGVSSFGLSGTNVHVIVKDAPFDNSKKQPFNDLHKHENIVVPISAADEPALEILAQRYIDLLNTQQYTTAEIGAAVALRRNDLPYRLCVYAKDNTSMALAIEEALREKIYQQYSNTEKNKKVIFVFPGQGSQWIGMGLTLLRTEPVFKRTLEECDEAIREFANWSLLEEMKKTGADNRFAEVNVIQPVLFAIEVSLARLWQAWGIQPDVVLGHSMGEVAAACIANAITVRDAARIICCRSKLASTIRGKGAMALVELSKEKAESMLVGYEDKVSIAACNGPSSTVLSGNPDAIDVILQQLTAQDIFNRLINVDFASHSPQVDELKDELLWSLRDVHPRKGTIPIYSTVRNIWMDGSELNARYWVDNLRNPVLFSQGVQQLLKEDSCVFIEISPHPVLLPLIEQNIILLRKSMAAVVPSLKREQSEKDEMLQHFCDAYMAGATVQWRSFYDPSVAGIDGVPIPYYPWQRQRYWIEEIFAGKSVYIHPDNKHSFAAHELKLAPEGATVCWESEISTRHFPYLAEHIVMDMVMFPASAYLEYVLSAAGITFGEGHHIIKDIRYKYPLILSGNTRKVQLVFSIEQDQLIAFHFFSAAINKEAGKTIWELHVAGHLVLSAATSTATFTQDTAWKDHNHMLPGFLQHHEHYEALNSRGLVLGSPFRGVKEIRFGSEVAIGKVLVDEIIAQAAADYIFHPAILDACLQVTLPFLPETLEWKGIYLPVSMKGYCFYTGVRITSTLWVKVQKECEASNNKEMFHCRIAICNDEGNILASIDDLCLKRQEQEYKQALTGSPHKNGVITQLLTCGSMIEAQEVMEVKLQELLARMLRTSITKMNVEMPFPNLGIDSLMASQVRGNIEKFIYTEIPKSTLWKYPNVRLLAEYLLQVIGVNDHFSNTSVENGMSNQLH